MEPLAIERSSNGLFFRPGGFYLDPKKRVEKAVISHGHADHALATNGHVWCTPGTAAIMRARYGDRLRSKLTVVPFGEPFEINGVSVCFYGAGHVLGSAQTLIEHEGIKYCYTGDFKTKPDDSCEPFQVIKCDVLITETTFADPTYVHPEDQLELNQLDRYLPFNWVVGAYSLGKAQRITSLLSKRFPERKIMVHAEPAVFHKVYEHHGYNLGTWEHYDRHELKADAKFILIVPPKVLSSYHGKPGMVTMFATGWLRPYIRSTHHLRISDHADWNELLNLIDSCGAKAIMTVHGDGMTLKSHLEAVSPNIKVYI
jgi:putative mRNA 3-end processing factor